MRGLISHSALVLYQIGSVSHRLRSRPPSAIAMTTRISSGRGASGPMMTRSHPTVIDAMPTRKPRFAVDSPVEGDGFEPSVHVAQEPVYIPPGFWRRRPTVSTRAGTHSWYWG